ncbi:hypothetical protein [Rubrobacter aplysinae]|uniref:hypothetical protein n=1 Tax=Rubrobacter aplysinae TaxID=909625 RepID=UPI00069F313C|nr:hypothetical protein [Rubrobacter aplysinae]
MQEEYTEVSNDSANALVRRVRTGNGARLEVYSPGAGTRVLLDALLLESLSWQSPEGLASGLDSPHERADGQREVEPSGDEPYTEFSNEFAVVLVRVVGESEDGRLEIHSPKLGYQVYLAAPLLETLSWQSPEKLSEALEEPYGPAGAAH